MKKEHIWEAHLLKWSTHFLNITKLIKTEWHWYKDKYVDRGNRILSTEVKLYIND